MTERPIILWFRNDLRLADNPALHFAKQRKTPLVPLYVWSPEEYGDWPPGAASRWWLHQALRSLRDDLRGCGSDLITRVGPSGKTILDLASQTNASAVFFNRCFQPALRERDEHVTRQLVDAGLEVQTYNGSLLFDVGDVRTGAGHPYKVFTPFWRACLAKPVPPQPLPKPRKLPEFPSFRAVASHEPDLLANMSWENKLADHWIPTESGAHANLREFTQHALAEYHTGRDLPAERKTSRLSPYLHFGQISPRQVWHAVSPHEHPPTPKSDETPAKSLYQYLAEIGWREFAYNLLHFFPETRNQPLRPEFADFPWERNAAALERWQRGMTGYPMVDAGMRELYATGWMHNRVRMIVASFLVKHLLIPWQDGAAWFWDTLVDADLASNTLGWQWTAGCGADAAPFFRIFNPITQGTKFDPTGGYVRRWCPELAELPEKWLHQPWEAPANVLGAAGVILGENYPDPIVDHPEARKRALDAYQTIKKQN